MFAITDWSDDQRFIGLFRSTFDSQGTEAEVAGMSGLLSTAAPEEECPMSTKVNKALVRHFYACLKSRNPMQHLSARILIQRREETLAHDLCHL